VRQLPQRPSTVNGITAPTQAEPARSGTKMSTYGHLTVRRADGSTGPLAGEVVKILVKRPADTAWWLIGSSRTTSSGYYYTNWSVPYQSGEQVIVRAQYTTTLPTVASTSAVVGGFTVQP
jgi:hypothetical protein